MWWSGGAGKTPHRERHRGTASARRARVASRLSFPAAMAAGPGDGVLSRSWTTQPARASGATSRLLHVRKRPVIPVYRGARSGHDRRTSFAGGSSAKCNLLVCDDGLQHLALGRDLEVGGVFDDRGVGNGWLLPAGLLREPWPLPHRRWASAVVRPMSCCASTAGTVAARCLRWRSTFLNWPTYGAASVRLADQDLTAQGHRTGAPGRTGAADGCSRHRHDPRSSSTCFASAAYVLERTAWRSPIMRVRRTMQRRWAVHTRAMTLICTEKDAVKLFPQLRLPGCDAWAVSTHGTSAPEPAFSQALRCS